MPLKNGFVVYIEVRITAKPTVIEINLIILNLELPIKWITKPSPIEYINTAGIDHLVNTLLKISDNILNLVNIILKISPNGGLTLASIK
jgi:hypothetical protein